MFKFGLITYKKKSDLRLLHSSVYTAHYPFPQFLFFLKLIFVILLWYEGHYGGGMGDESSSSGAELEAGELVIDDSYTHLSKKKKKSKKSKKKKDKEKDRDKEKSGKDKKHSKGFSGEFTQKHFFGNTLSCIFGIGIKLWKQRRLYCLYMIIKTQFTLFGTVFTG